MRELDLGPDRSGLPGVQDKTSAAMINVPAARAGRQHLLKLAPPEHPGLVENEAVFLRAAGLNGLRAAQAEVIRDREGAPGLAVVRFDRPVIAGSQLYLAVEDGCQVLGRPPGDKYLIGYAAAFAALAAACDARLLALRTLLAQLSFAILTGNGDAHAKNFSVLQQPDGEWRVCPAYDVPSSYPYGDTTLAMAVNGRRSDAGTKDLLALGAELGLPEPAVRRVLRTTTEHVVAASSSGWSSSTGDGRPPPDAPLRRRPAEGSDQRVVRQRRGRCEPS